MSIVSVTPVTVTYHPNSAPSPEGELFTVDLLERTQLVDFDSDAAATSALTAVVSGIANVTAWHLQFDLITQIRRLAIMRPQSLSQETCGSTIIPFVVEQSRAARSSVARNGLMAIDDLVATCSDKLIVKAAAVATALLESCASNQPKVIRATAAKALDTACVAATTDGAGSTAASSSLRVALAPALAMSTGHKNRDVQMNAMVYTSECQRVDHVREHDHMQPNPSKCLTHRNHLHAAGACIEGMSPEQLKDALDCKALLPSLYIGLTKSKSPEGKKAATTSCLALCKGLGDAEWESRVAAALAPDTQGTVLAAGKPVAKKEKPKGARKSGRRKFVPPRGKQSGGAKSGSSDSFEVAALPPPAPRGRGVETGAGGAAKVVTVANGSYGSGSLSLMFGSGAYAIISPKDGGGSGGGVTTKASKPRRKKVAVPVFRKGRPPASKGLGGKNEACIVANGAYGCGGASMVFIGGVYSIIGQDQPVGDHSAMMLDFKPAAPRKKRLPTPLTRVGGPTGKEGGMVVTPIGDAHSAAQVRTVTAGSYGATRLALTGISYRIAVEGGSNGGAATFKATKPRARRKPVALTRVGGPTGKEGGVVITSLVAFERVSDPAEPEEHEHHVEFSLELHDHDLASFHDGHQAALLEILHGHLDGHLDGHLVEIDRIEVGSVVVHVRVRHPPGSEDHHTEKTVDLLSDHSALSEKLVS